MASSLLRLPAKSLPRVRQEPGGLTFRRLSGTVNGVLTSGFVWSGSVRKWVNGKKAQLYTRDKCIRPRCERMLAARWRDCIRDRQRADYARKARPRLL